MGGTIPKQMSNLNMMKVRYVEPLTNMLMMEGLPTNGLLNQKMMLLRVFGIAGRGTALIADFFIFSFFIIIIIF